MMLEGDQLWRIVELPDGTRVVVDPDGVIAGTTDAPASATLSAVTPSAAPVEVAPAGVSPAEAAPAGVAPADTGLLGSVVTTAASTVGTAVAGAADTVVHAVTAPISFDTGSLADLSTLLRTAADRIEEQLDQLADTGQKLSGTWSGDADHAFRAAHREWSARLDELHRILSDSAHLTREVEESLVETETKIQDLWS